MSCLFSLIKSDMLHASLNPWSILISVTAVQFATFIFFAACVSVMTLTVNFLLPETKGVPIEEVLPPSNFAVVSMKEIACVAYQMLYSTLEWLY